MPMADGSGRRMRTTPIPVPRSRRTIEHRVLTSFQPGYCVPVMAIPLLREDQLETTRIRLAFEMLETVEILANAVNVRAIAHLVPFSAFERFEQSMDQFNRSYMKQPKADGAAVTPFINAQPFNKANMNIFTKMGYHAREGQSVNTAVVEAYNCAWNFRAKNRSPDLPLRSNVDYTLAKAFWRHQLFAHVVPDFDQAAIEGEVPLTIVNPEMQVRGLGNMNPGAAGTNPSIVFANGQPQHPIGSITGWQLTDAAPAAGQTKMFVQQKPGQTNVPNLWAELDANGITVSLANIEVARKTQAFALLRKQYNGLSDDYIMDLLMSGIRIPDMDLMQPLLLADKSTVFGMNKRYATTADDLTASVVNGGTFIDLTLRTPRISTGGIVIVCVEVTPEQLFERQADKFMITTDQDLYPEYIRDETDPEKVEIMRNEDVDIKHATPTATFGYRPLNTGWGPIIQPKIGGKFYRPDPDGAFDEDRQRIWAVETANPTLAADFYLCSNVHQKPFVVTTQDNFEVLVRGNSVISGNTVFGRMLVEASDDYDEIMGEVPLDPIVKPASTETVEAPSMETPDE